MTRAGAASAAFLLASYVGLALAYRGAIPLFEAPDEPSHLHYAVFVAEHARLPREQPQEVPGEGMQPPLAYLAAVPFFRWTGLDASRVARELDAVDRYVYGFAATQPGRASLAFAPNGRRLFRTDGTFAALAALRTASLAFGALAVGFAFAAAWRASRDPWFALVATGLLAFDPQFLFVSGYFSNDPAAAAAGAAALWIVVDAIARGGPARAHFAAGGTAIAFGLLAKSSTLPGLAVAAVTIATLDRRPARDRALDGALALGVALAIAGPYLAWSIANGRGLLGLGAIYASASQLHVPTGQSHLSGPYWTLTFESYWARFGWMNVAAPRAVIAAFFALTTAGVIGCLLTARRPPDTPLGSPILRRYLLASVLATGAAHLVLNLSVVSAQGRQLFSSAPQFALLLALGLDRIFGNRRAVLVPMTLTALLALDVYCWTCILAPAYRELPH